VADKSLQHRGAGASTAKESQSTLDGVRLHYANQLALGRVHRVEQRISDRILDEFRKIESVNGAVTGAVSDALDKLGVHGAVSASELKPTIHGAEIVGRARTLKQIPVSGAATANASADRNPGWQAMAVHLEAHRGDVIVVQSPGGASSAGAAGIPLGQAQGEVGAIVDGAIRDVGVSRRLGFPMWAREITPISGKWRIEHVEINGVVTIAGVRVTPGDLVVADDDGVCFVPADLCEKVLEFCYAKRRREVDVYGT
jgi:regulator of RNase E activity RraA